MYDSLGIIIYYCLRKLILKEKISFQHISYLILLDLSLRPAVQYIVVTEKYYLETKIKMLLGILASVL